jgi:hypothetical protein
MMEQTESRTSQPLVSAGKTEVPPGYAEAVKNPATWNEQVGEILARMVDERGGRWTVMSGLLGNRKRMRESVDVSDKSETFEIRWYHVRFKSKAVSSS